MQKEEHRERFGQFLKKAIKESGVKQKVFAESLSLMPQYISKIVSGKVVPDEKNFQDILDKLSKSVDEVTVYRLSNLYDAAKYGRIRTISGEPAITDPFIKHFVEMLEKLDDARQNKLMKVLLGMLSENDSNNVD